MKSLASSSSRMQASQPKYLALAVASRLITSSQARHIVQEKLRLEDLGIKRKVGWVASELGYLSEPEQQEIYEKQKTLAEQQPDQRSESLRVLFERLSSREDPVDPSEPSWTPGRVLGGSILSIAAWLAVLAVVAFLEVRAQHDPRFAVYQAVWRSSFGLLTIVGGAVKGILAQNSPTRLVRSRILRIAVRCVLSALWISSCVGALFVAAYGHTALGILWTIIVVALAGIFSGFGLGMASWGWLELRCASRQAAHLRLAHYACSMLRQPNASNEILNKFWRLALENFARAAAEVPGNVAVSWLFRLLPGYRPLSQALRSACIEFYEVVDTDNDEVGDRLLLRFAAYPEAPVEVVSALRALENSFRLPITDRLWFNASLKQTAKAKDPIAAFRQLPGHKHKVSLAGSAVSYRRLFWAFRSEDCRCSNNSQVDRLASLLSDHRKTAVWIHTGPEVACPVPPNIPPMEESGARVRGVVLLSRMEELGHKVVDPQIAMEAARALDGCRLPSGSPVGS